MPRVFRDNQKVKVIRAPKEAPHLLGMVGEVAYEWGKRIVRVHVNNEFTDFHRDDLEPLPEK